MGVYVDDMYAPYGRMKMCHMIADTRKELDEMADCIGVARKWIQKPNTPEEHYDVAMAARRKAVVAGAIQISSKELVKIIRKKRDGKQMRFTNYEVFLVRCLNALGLFVLIVMIYTACRYVAVFLQSLLGY